MARENLFTMRVSTEERELLAALAKQEQRPAADIIRGLVRKAAQQHERTPPPSKSAPAGVAVPS